MTQQASSPPAFVWSPFISFEDTNLVGNVYFAKFVSWQGRCREAFLAEHAPDVLEMLAGVLRLVTIKTSCEYFEELAAFDKLEIEMRLHGQRGNRIELEFRYCLESHGHRRLAALGWHEIACMQVTTPGSGLIPAEVPPSLQKALRGYAA
ncbi:acyl-CoA thioesterase [Sphingomonas sp. MMS12-HWE2-04]|uniref:acyl-CoA thioesterase n=1 Tax=Sphingomonas sp. MMS12-HWE2-04 TaxID=3234199 RepID=UPI00384EE3AD